MGFYSINKKFFLALWLFCLTCRNTNKVSRLGKLTFMKLFLQKLDNFLLQKLIFLCLFEYDIHFSNVSHFFKIKTNLAKVKLIILESKLWISTQSSVFLPFLTFHCKNATHCTKYIYNGPVHSMLDLDLKIGVNPLKNWLWPSLAFLLRQVKLTMPTPTPSTTLS